MMTTTTTTKTTTTTTMMMSLIHGSIPQLNVSWHKSIGSGILFQVDDLVLPCPLNTRICTLYSDPQMKGLKENWFLCPQHDI